MTSFFQDQAYLTALSLTYLVLVVGGRMLKAIPQVSYALAIYS